MAELWGKTVLLYGKRATVGEIFRNWWGTGEQAKTLVLQRIVQQLVPSEREGAFETLVIECSKEANERILKGNLPRPKDWMLALPILLDLSRIVDDEGILRDQSKLSVFRGQLMSIIASATA